MSIALDLIRPGDTLLYSGNGAIDWIIRTKTWSRYSHCEFYDGGGYSLASRNGIGVARYPTRVDGLKAVYRLRDSVPFGIDAARDYFETVDGQGYDWVGLLSFTAAKYQGRLNSKLFCSEFQANLYRAGIGSMLKHPDGPSGDRRLLQVLGVDPFGGEVSDAIPPAAFARSGCFVEVTAA